MTSYLEKRALFPPQIKDHPSDELQIIVVIPCYDEPDLIKSLESLKNCSPPKSSVEVIVVFNSSENENEDIKKINQRRFEEAHKWASKHSSSDLKFFILKHFDLPDKTAGVGLARKIGMDEAVYRFESIGNQKGIIVCFDADSLCEPNYFQAIENHFVEHPNTQACSIHFEHPIEGDQFDDSIYKAIILYELHLRYYNNAKRYTGFPFAFETIGSSMAVRCDAYQQQGGMNKRKAGEDFYFLNKFMPLGNFTELKSTTVIPSPRKSHRVLFGTGKAVGEIVESSQFYGTYAPQTFVDLRIFFDSVPLFFNKQKNEIDEMISVFPKSVLSFLEKHDFDNKIVEIQSNTTNLKTFYNRFFRWFNGFLMMKYVHYVRDEFYPNVPVEEASIWLLTEYFNYELPNKIQAKELLEIFRKEDRK